MVVVQNDGSFTAEATLKGEDYEDSGTIEGTVNNVGEVSWTSTILCGGTFSGELDVVGERAEGIAIWDSTPCPNEADRLLISEVMRLDRLASPSSYDTDAARGQAWRRARPANR